MVPPRLRTTEAGDARLSGSDAQRFVTAADDVLEIDGSERKKRTPRSSKFLRSLLSSEIYRRGRHSSKAHRIRALVFLQRVKRS
jgi:hypothetical protein